MQKSSKKWIKSVKTVGVIVWKNLQGKLCLPVLFVSFSSLTVQRMRWRQRLAGDWLKLPWKGKSGTRQRQVAMRGSEHKHGISCHQSLIGMYFNGTWNSSGDLGKAARGGMDSLAEKCALLLWGDMWVTLEERAASPGHSKQEHWSLSSVWSAGVLQVTMESRLQTSEICRSWFLLTVFIRATSFSSMLKKICGFFQYTREGFTSQ